MTALRGEMTGRSAAGSALLRNMIWSGIIGAILIAAMIGLSGLAGTLNNSIELTNDLIGSWESTGNRDVACSSPSLFPKRLDFFFSGAYGYSNGAVMKSGVFAANRDSLYLDQGGGAVLFHAAVFELEFGDLLVLQSGARQIAYYKGV